MFRRLAAEGIGSLLLAATVIGSGIMAERLSAGNMAVALPVAERRDATGAHGTMTIQLAHRACPRERRLWFRARV